MTNAPTFLQALAASLALACFSGSPASAQEVLSPAERDQIACVAMSIPAVRTAIEAGTGPLLLVSGREAGHLRRPASCPAKPELPRRASEFSYVRPHTAPTLYGDGARNGAILIDLPPGRGS